MLTPGRALAGTGVAVLAAVGVLEAAFWLGRMVPAWSPVLLGFPGSAGSLGVMRLRQEEAQKRSLRASFSQYVPPQLVEELVRSPERLREQGKRRKIAILFSDVRGFTPYAEQHPPELVLRQMGEYLSEMTESVHEHGGVLDKFIGDSR